MTILQKLRGARELFQKICLTIPVLGAARFEALGLTAGTTAASWQASLGLVKAGSLFA